MSQKKPKINSRAKGKSFERTVAKHLTEWWGVPFRSTPGSGSLHWAKDSRVSGDIVPPPDSDFPFSVECKKHESWDFFQVLKRTGDMVKWWEQCVGDAEEVEKIPLLIFSKNRAPIFFVLRFKEFSRIAPLISTNHFLTTFELENGELEDVGIGFFDSMKEISKDTIIELLTE